MVMARRAVEACGTAAHSRRGGARQAGGERHRASRRPVRQRWTRRWRMLRRAAWPPPTTRSRPSPPPTPSPRVCGTLKPTWAWRLRAPSAWGWPTGGRPGGPAPTLLGTPRPRQPASPSCSDGTPPRRAPAAAVWCGLCPTGRVGPRAIGSGGAVRRHASGNVRCGGTPAATQGSHCWRSRRRWCAASAAAGRYGTPSAMAGRPRRCALNTRGGGGGPVALLVLVAPLGGAGRDGRRRCRSTMGSGGFGAQRRGAAAVPPLALPVLEPRCLPRVPGALHPLTLPMAAPAAGQGGCAWTPCSHPCGGSGGRGSASALVYGPLYDISCFMLRSRCTVATPS